MVEKYRILSSSIYIFLPKNRQIEIYLVVKKNLNNSEIALKIQNIFIYSE